MVWDWPARLEQLRSACASLAAWEMLAKFPVAAREAWVFARPLQRAPSDALLAVRLVRELTHTHTLAP